MNEMKVSVAMITYFHEAYIEDALNGILMQKTDFDFEIVIGEDASKDTTPEILKRYVERHPDKFRVTFHENNVGMMPNFVSTLNACKGEYIAICEGDDYWTDEYKLQKQVDFMTDNPTFCGCFHNVIVKDERHPNLKPKPWRSYNKDVFGLLDTFSRTALLHTCSILFKRSNLETPDWFFNVKSGDMSLFAVIASKGKLGLLSGNMSVYRKNDGGITNSETLKNYHSNRILLWNHVNEHYDFKYKKEITELLDFHRSEISNLSASRIKRILRRLISQR